MLNVKVWGWRGLGTEMNIHPVLITAGRVHYSPQVGYHNCKLVLNFDFFFLFSFAGIAMGNLGHYKQGYSSSEIIVSLFQTIFKKKFVSFVWHKQNKLHFTMVLEYYWRKCRWFSTCPSYSLGDCLIFFQPVRTWRLVFKKWCYTPLSPAY